MPIYTYRCENCGVQFERTQKFTDPTLTRCPECNKKTLRKVYTPVGIVFKGSGFYATAKAAGIQERQEKQDTKDKSEKPAETKTETPKPAASDSSTPASKPEKSD